MSISIRCSLLFFVVKKEDACEQMLFFWLVLQSLIWSNSSYEPSAYQSSISPLKFFHMLNKILFWAVFEYVMDWSFGESNHSSKLSLAPESKDKIHKVILKNTNDVNFFYSNIDTIWYISEKTKLKEIFFLLLLLQLKICYNIYVSIILLKKFHDFWYVIT